jgi:hypothetical protein
MARVGKQGVLTSGETNDLAEADLDLGDQGLNLDDEGEDGLELGDVNVDVEGQAIEDRDTVEEVLQVDLEVNECADEGLGIDVGVDTDGDWQR